MIKQPLSARSSRDGTVLSIGANPELLWLREAVLQQAGFDVFTTSDPKQAIAKVEAGNCGVLLLCHSLHEDFRNQLAEQFSKSCPDGRIVTITNDKLSELPPYADSLVYGIEGPEALIAVLRDGSTPSAQEEIA